MNTEEKLMNNRTEDDTDLCPKRILLADDDREMRDMLAEALMNAGYDVIVCTDGWSLIRNLGLMYLPEDRERADLIITDIRMPGINGIEILTALHAFNPLPPLVFITAFGDSEIHEQAETLGAIHVFDKPFDIPGFLEKIHWILQINRKMETRSGSSDDDGEGDISPLADNLVKKLGRGGYHG